jgi:hypothetical protein
MRFLSQINEFMRRIQTTGKVAAQEQVRIIGQYIDNISTGYKEVTISI